MNVSATFSRFIRQAVLYGLFLAPPLVNPMYWRSLFVFLGIHFFLVVAVYPGFSGPGLIDLARYIRILIRAVCLGSVIYLFLRLGDFALVRSFT